ncbi:MAG: winged helix-turn-helix transcriptional regulator [Clostridium argentinense]|uniref:Winged helix-turn-helix transcriptional regulator n=1 Tax=Clostridium faecium TaxID=2762223 RepID=A0ABR8YRP5_9CLOT|nr:MULTISPECIES: winged helix-turn-helix domain-containing protein [Clostridium]MBD8046895.1 winged helix-turn-helix transcriptional regulator [Clostridium faecium]MBS5823064.1 winged helix-turn-helix transcriptional regulator [Clostridium argentinense]MDU1349861.1 winged helix-turn-helix domain-containing protein [Clostridium argentinense]
MGIKIYDKLNPICEIFGLIYMSQNYDEVTNLLIKELNNSGINGELFFKKNLKIFDKYIKTFNKYKVVNESEVFFFDEDDTAIFLVIAFTLINNEDLINSIDNMTNEEIKAIILDVYNEQFEQETTIDSISTLNNIIEFIKELDLKEDTKWKLMIILNDPKKYYKSLIKTIEDNRNAYREAYKAVEKSLSKLISNYIKYVNSDKCEVLNNVIKNHDSKINIIPTLSFGTSLFEFKNTYFVGVLYEITYNEYVNSMGNKGELILKLKALSDKSKLEIISLLKTEPKYSLEIAEALDLTPATVSYHMGSLLECGMVVVEKKQGKVYYNLNKTGLKNFIDELNSALL